MKDPLTPEQRIAFKQYLISNFCEVYEAVLESGVLPDRGPGNYSPAHHAAVLAGERFRYSDPTLIAELDRLRKAITYEETSFDFS